MAKPPEETFEVNSSTKDHCSGSESASVRNVFGSPGSFKKFLAKIYF
jgi:hypothetical protein